MDMLRFSGGSEEPGEEMMRPSIAMVPSLGARKPAIIRSVVVLPQPDGPRSETNSPGWSVRLKRSTAVTLPKRRLTSVRARLAHVAVRFSRKSRPTRRKPTSTSATVTTTRIRPMEESTSKLPSSLLSKSSTESTWVPVV